MKILDSLIQKIEAIPVNTFIREVIDDNKSIIEDKNAEQLNRGEMPDSSKITPPYKAITKRIKQVKGQPFDRVTLKDEGSFHKSITLNLESDGFTMDATDPKTEELLEKYGDVLGLGDRAKTELVTEILKPEILDKTRKYFKV